MENIFKNTYFGKPYKTRDGRKAKYAKKHESGLHSVIVDGFCDTIFYLKNGAVWGIDKEHNLDIVSEWKEEINKEELDKLAISFANGKMNISIPERNGRYAGYKAGFRQALTNK